MRIQSGQVIALAVGILALGACTPPANATVPATGTRLAIGGGGPRFYMTYGHMRDAELYAPVTQELRRLGLS
ncbi:MAG: hypothetical protein FJX77_02155, partial [Armatimonadetes bacterium]|nr:hypothetical protein [Armatimonadota bacterium]